MVNILVIDDTDSIRKLLVRMLAIAGHEALEAADGESALKLVAANPDLRLVICDVNMPNMDGMELAKRLRRDWPRLKIVFVTGFAEASLVDAGLRVNVDFFLKPFSTEALLGRVREVLAAPAAE